MNQSSADYSFAMPSGTGLKILEKAMHRYRVSVLEDDPARVVFLRSASYDLHVACRKLDEFERGIK